MQCFLTNLLGIKRKAHPKLLETERKRSGFRCVGVGGRAQGRRPPAIPRQLFLSTKQEGSTNQFGWLQASSTCIELRVPLGDIIVRGSFVSAREHACSSITKLSV